MGDPFKTVRRVIWLGAVMLVLSSMINTALAYRSYRLTVAAAKHANAVTDETERVITEFKTKYVR